MRPDVMQCDVRRDVVTLSPVGSRAFNDDFVCPSNCFHVTVTPPPGIAEDFFSRAVTWSSTFFVNRYSWFETQDGTTPIANRVK